MEPDLIDRTRLIKWGGRWAIPKGSTDQVVVSSYGGQGVTELALVQGLTTTSGEKIAQSGQMHQISLYGSGWVHMTGEGPVLNLWPLQCVRRPIYGVLACVILLAPTIDTNEP